MKKCFRAAIVAALVAPLFAVAAPQASADEGPLDGSRVDVFVPSIISICIRAGDTCPGID